MTDKPEKQPMTGESLKKRRPLAPGLEPGNLIKAFFGGNALVAIVVLGLITVFLFREGVEFFPQYQRSLQLYRASGQEFVGLMKREIEEFHALQRELDEVLAMAVDRHYDSGRGYDEVRQLEAPLLEFARRGRAAVEPLRAVTKEAVDLTTAAKDEVVVAAARAGTDGTRAIEGAAGVANARALELTRERVRAMTPRFKQAAGEFRANLRQVLASAPRPAREDERAALAGYIERAREYLRALPRVVERLDDYDPGRPVGLHESVGGFLFGARWTTNSSWQDFYGIWPLLSGSLLVTTVALTFAIPLGVCAAIYVNQVASAREQNLIKPYIEFISAIPSVVIGFFGIAVFGTTVRWLSEQQWLEWLPFFPVSERLNAFTAGALLALMAIPTIFTLAEDAINNVPGAFKEASVAMGATNWQTIYRILVPTALSGIISAVLLGFGRVIGETMVVLLCAGNRIMVPDLGDGLGAFFEPVHTMTGIIAQEMGEVVPGSIHYRALFCVGIFLFFLSLGINYLAQHIVRKYRISSG